MKYRYLAVERFWTNFYRLPSSQKESARKAWEIFKENPFDPCLRPHKIQSLSSHYGRIEIEGDLRLVFYVEGDTVFSLTIGSHDIYKV